MPSYSWPRHEYSVLLSVSYSRLQYITVVYSRLGLEGRQVQILPVLILETSLHYKIIVHTTSSEETPFQGNDPNHSPWSSRCTVTPANIILALAPPLRGDLELRRE
jgi:hypothetical protein